MELVTSLGGHKPAEKRAEKATDAGAPLPATLSIGLSAGSGVKKPSKGESNGAVKGGTWRGQIWEEEEEKAGRGSRLVLYSAVLVDPEVLAKLRARLQPGFSGCHIWPE
ncbi:hypothetical protein N7507_004550 [Penicillium longicatenatum]|nr:hypothetical protein N7507_004550 [Penicillium longicatenatum]